jgi:hypothetical protein
MHFLSSIVATLLGLVLCRLLNNMLSRDELPANEEFWMIFAGIYAAVAIIAGWRYVVSGRRAFGWIHALLMLGVAGLCAVYGLSILGDRSIAGGRGPDANPAAGIIYGIALLGILIAVVTAVCGIGVIRHVLRKRKNERPPG